MKWQGKYLYTAVDVLFIYLFIFAFFVNIVLVNIVFCQKKIHFFFLKGERTVIYIVLLGINDVCSFVCVCEPKLRDTTMSFSGDER